MNRKRGNRLILTPQQEGFTRLVAAGSSYAEAYRKIYSAKVKPQAAAERGLRVARRPLVAAELQRLREKAERKVLLTLNDRLEILADIAQDGKARPHEKARAIEVYSKISGDQAPERHEVTGAGGGPIPVAATAAVSVTRIPVRERMALMRAARAAAAQPEAKP